MHQHCHMTRLTNKIYIHARQSHHPCPSREKAKAPNNSRKEISVQGSEPSICPIKLLCILETKTHHCCSISHRPLRQLATWIGLDPWARRKRPVLELIWWAQLMRGAGCKNIATPFRSWMNTVPCHAGYRHHWWRRNGVSGTVRGRRDISVVDTRMTSCSQWVSCEV